ncbi:hypothetical protein NDU88_005185 [Pleurodeles waltl]|uniref:Uncharacterized protein n=1 Tax=Pleurodeles waltl TaxID=8319 RepID=A0AAV7TWJ3_PLEWA|nr:hypothetical protein NDU88_005185 [Pleurodeles waltl]
MDFKSGATLASPSDGTAVIMVEIRAGFQATDSRFDTLDARLDRMNEHIDCQAARMEGAEHRRSEVEDGCADTQKRLDRVEHFLKMVASKNEDLEAHNVRIAGVADSTDTGRMGSFVEKLLVELFGRGAFTSPFIVESMSCPGAPLHPVIAMHLNFRDQDTVLHQAREKAPMQYQGMSISIYTIFMPLVQDALRKYADAKALLQKSHIHYTMLYPVQLHIEMDGKQYIFTPPAVVASFCQLHHIGTALCGQRGSTDSATVSLPSSQDARASGGGPSI